MTSHAPAMTTDYLTAEGCPQPHLRQIAEAGFSHVHWCHQWCTDFLYDDAEVDQIAMWLDEFSLSLNDLHGSHGREKAWGSTRTYQRQAGVELVKNRIDMARRLNCDVVIVHIPPGHDSPNGRGAFWESWAPSLDALAPYARRRGVRIALENSHDDNFDTLEEAFDRYGSDFLGLCYDAGHGNLAGNGLDRLDANKDRLISLHLHDNDGAADLHRLPFTGTVDWARLSDIIATSSYAKDAITFETVMRNSPIDTESEFLAQAAGAAHRMTAMIAAAREP